MNNESRQTNSGFDGIKGTSRNGNEGSTYSSHGNEWSWKEINRSKFIWVTTNNREVTLCYPFKNRKIEATIHHTEHIESDIQNLKNRMVHDSDLLMNLYNEFVKLKHEILGIDMDDEDNMEVEE